MQATREQVREARAGERPGVSLDPASAYEAVTRQMVVGLQEDLREIKGRLNGLLFLVAGSVLLDLLRRWGG
ncbi:MAG: hypothetical protein QM692_16415 [Thermomicrobiales bacterium]